MTTWLAVDLHQFYMRSWLPTSLSMFGSDRGKDSPAHIKTCCEAHKTRFCGLYQVIEDTVGNRFVVVTLVAKTPSVEFEAFQLDA